MGMNASLLRRFVELADERLLDPRGRPPRRAAERRGWKALTFPRKSVA